MSWVTFRLGKKKLVALHWKGAAGMNHTTSSTNTPKDCLHHLYTSNNEFGTSSSLTFARVWWCGSGGCGSGGSGGDRGCGGWGGSTWFCVLSISDLLLHLSTKQHSYGILPSWKLNSHSQVKRM